MYKRRNKKMQKKIRNNYMIDVKLQTVSVRDKDNWNSFSGALKNKGNRYSSDEVIGKINPEMDRIIGRYKR